MIHLVIFTAAILAFGVSAISGGGAGLILVPLLGLVLPAVQVPAALSLGTATSAFSRLAVFRKAVRWDIVRWFLPAALPFTIVGAWLLTTMQPVYVSFFLGVFLCSNVVALLRGGASVRSPVRPSRLAILAIGSATGFLSAFTGAVGLVFNGFYLRSGLSKEEIVATRAANEGLLHLVKLGLYAAFGLMGRETVVVGVVVATAGVVAAWGAKHGLRFVTENGFRRIGYASMSLAGLAMLFSAGTAIARQQGVTAKARVDMARFDMARFEARVGWRHHAIAIEWSRGQALEFERTIAITTLPPHVRAVVEAESLGASRVVCEEVRGFGVKSYEISIERPDRHLKIKI
jgi:uncharacterized membrane protein YfcA